MAGSMDMHAIYIALKIFILKLNGFDTIPGKLFMFTIVRFHA